MAPVKPIFLLGEAWGANEARVKAGFCGASGIALFRMLVDAGLLTLTSEDQSYINLYYNNGDPSMIDMVWRMHPEFHRSNVFEVHPPDNDLIHLTGPREEGIPGYAKLYKGYIRDEFRPHLERLADELITVDPNIVVALGGSAMWALTGNSAITKLRGTTRVSTMLATGYKLLPTYHPAAVLRQHELRSVTVADLIKAGRESTFPEIRRPRREIWIEPTLEDIETFCDNYITNCDLLSVDIETAGTQITEIGFAPSTTLAIVIPFFDRRKKNRSYWPTTEAEQAVWRIVRRVLEDRTIRKLFQNGLYDIAFLLRAAGIAVRGASEDTMLLHHALQPEMLKGLGFLGSLYCDEGAWKGMRKVATIKRDE